MNQAETVPRNSIQPRVTSGQPDGQPGGQLQKDTIIHSAGHQHPSHQLSARVSNGSLELPMPSRQTGAQLPKDVNAVANALHDVSSLQSDGTGRKTSHQLATQSGLSMSSSTSRGQSEVHVNLLNPPRQRTLRIDLLGGPGPSPSVATPSTVRHSEVNSVTNSYQQSQTASLGLTNISGGVLQLPDKVLHTIVAEIEERMHQVIEDASGDRGCGQKTNRELAYVQPVQSKLMRFRDDSRCER